MLMLLFTNMIDYLINNHTWIFSGIGTAILSGIAGLIIGGGVGYRIGIRKSIHQKQIAGSNSEQSQIGKIENNGYK